MTGKMILIVLICWLAFITSCASKEPLTAHISVDGNIATVDLPVHSEAVGWLVTIDKRTEDGFQRVLGDIYRAGKPFRVVLPKGDYRVGLKALLPMVEKEGKAGTVSLDPKEIAVQESDAKTIALEESPLDLVSIAELPEYAGRIVLVRGYRRDGAAPFPGASPSKWLDVNYPMKSYTLFIADEKGAVIQPINLTSETLPPMFVHFEALVLFGPIKMPLGKRGIIWSGRALYVYRIKPLGLERLSPIVAKAIQKDWDGKSPLPDGKDERLNRAYRDSIEYLESLGIAVDDKE